MSRVAIGFPEERLGDARKVAAQIAGVEVRLWKGAKAVHSRYFVGENREVFSVRVLASGRIKASRISLRSSMVRVLVDGKQRSVHIDQIMHETWGTKRKQVSLRANTASLEDILAAEESAAVARYATGMQRRLSLCIRQDIDSGAYTQSDLGTAAGITGASVSRFLSSRQQLSTTSVAAVLGARLLLLGTIGDPVEALRAAAPRLNLSQISRDLGRYRDFLRDVLRGEAHLVDGDAERIRELIRV